MKLTRSAALVLSVLAAAWPAPAAGQASDPVSAAAATITEEDFAWRVGVLAHDSMQGRNTPSPGLDMAADWIASEFRRLGLQGGGDDGAFIQRYPLTGSRVDPERSSFLIGSDRLRFGSDLVAASGSLPDRAATAELVVVSGTASVPRSVRRAVEGAHVLLVGPRSEGRNRALFQASGIMLQSGAASVSMVNGVDEGRWEDLAAPASISLSKGWGREESGAVESIVLHLRRSSADRVLEALGMSLSEAESRSGGEAVAHATGIQVTLTTRSEEVTSSAPNVVGILPGSDPVLAGEYVVFSAHMDHVGMRTPDASGDSIFNGADDDASGTSAVLEIAEAMAGMETAPRRSMIFLTVSGEEKGLWGSEWYAEHPSVPVDQLVANLNLDMVGRNWPDTIVAIGKEHSDLGETLARVNARHPELGMTAIDDLWPGERFYFRSDHYNFARKGVPILFFFNGTHDDYHGRDDEPDRIDAEKAARIARLVFRLGVEVGDADARPRWNPESYERIVTGGRTP